MFANKVLVALDASDAAEKALKRGVLIADRLGSELEVLWLFNPVGEHPLKRTIAHLQTDGMVIHEFTHEAKSFLLDVLKRWESDKFALLIKSCDADHSGLLAPIDWQLLRQAPCPVLLVKKDSLWEGGKIMMAVDPLSTQPDRKALNASVVKMADFIAQEARAELNVVVSFAPPMLGADRASQTVDLSKQRATEAAEQLLGESGVAPSEYLVGEGPADYWIPHIAQQQQAALVVIGTRARDGLKGMLLGNTAERILDRLVCDVLVVRAGATADINQILQR